MLNSMVPLSLLVHNGTGCALGRPRTGFRWLSACGRRRPWTWRGDQGNVGHTMPSCRCAASEILRHTRPSWLAPGNDERAYAGKANILRARAGDPVVPESQFVGRDDPTFEG